MAESRNCISNDQLDLGLIVQAAKWRWLSASEICVILRNYTKFELESDPPVMPPAGTLFLFNRKVQQYFQNDGHRWRTPKDGKTNTEVHEELKVGGVHVLQGYYAHGEDNVNLQRRCYWMLGQLEHIVLVHYGEGKRGLQIWHLTFEECRFRLRSPQSYSAPCFEQSYFLDCTAPTSYASNPNSVYWNEETIYSRFKDVDSRENPGTSSLVQTDAEPPSRDTSLCPGFLELPRNRFGSEFPRVSFNPVTNLSTWYQVDGHGPSSESKFYVEQPNTADRLSNELICPRLDGDNSAQDVSLCGYELMLDSQTVVQAYDTSTGKVQNLTEVSMLKKDDNRELTKPDSSERWMDMDIVDYNDTLIASDLGKYSDTLNTENLGKEVPSLSQHMQLDTDSVDASLPQEKLFSISGFAPDWAYSGDETKVLIIGTFLGSKNHYWSCMFGEIEVPAEVVTDNAVRCQVPFHDPGRVHFYITSTNRLACSEVREFEYRQNKSRVVYPIIANRYAPEDQYFLIRLAKLLCSGIENIWLGCSIANCEKFKLKNELTSLKVESKRSWRKIEAALNSRDLLIQKLLNDKLYDWLICKKHEVDKGLHTLDDKGLGIVHLAAALGYKWAIHPMVVSGVSVNFRDLKGRTALHWASFYGREEAVVLLISLGAASGAVDDPTPTIPGGPTAADLATIGGHKGIAGYLAEADLTSHLQALSINENAVSTTAKVAAESAIKAALQHVILRSVRELDEGSSLKSSVAAFRRSAYAAACIEDVLRPHSFCHRQLSESSKDRSAASLDLVALGSLNEVQMSHFEDYFHSAAVRIQKNSAAVRIQKKYRGWKRRKDFLKIRKSIVPI